MPDRWDRLVASLAEAGVTITVDRKPYVEQVYGRITSGTSCSARLILADRRHVVISDGWWRKNPEVWIGWQVILEDAEGIGIRTWRATKKRSEVVAAVLTAVGKETNSHV